MIHLFINIFIRNGKFYTGISIVSWNLPNSPKHRRPFLKICLALKKISNLQEVFMLIWINRAWCTLTCKELEFKMNLHTSRIPYQKDSSCKCQICTKVLDHSWSFKFVQNMKMKYLMCEVPNKILKPYARGPVWKIVNNWPKKVLCYPLSKIGAFDFLMPWSFRKKNKEIKKVDFCSILAVFVSPSMLI